MCESYGATFQGRKLGTFGLMADFSFYYAHHMSTVEGGMICTNELRFYETLRMLRSHGMVRESKSPDLRQSYYEKYPDLNPDFIFAFPGYNVRSTEINAVIGRSHLATGTNNRSRTKIYDCFSNLTGEIPKGFRVGEAVIMPPWCSTSRSGLVRHVLKAMRHHGVEFRRGKSGRWQN